MCLFWLQIGANTKSGMNIMTFWISKAQGKEWNRFLFSLTTHDMWYYFSSWLPRQKKKKHLPMTTQCLYPKYTTYIYIVVIGFEKPNTPRPGGNENRNLKYIFNLSQILHAAPTDRIHHKKKIYSHVPEWLSTGFWTGYYIYWPL
jgi:hypothetical protein